MSEPSKIRTGEKIRQGRDRFQAFLAPCESAEDVPGILRRLERKTKGASHVSWALRPGNPGSVTEMKSDGGESGSGNCILDVMRKRKARNVLVVVARWYGGRHLGSLRFRIYRKLTGRILKKGNR